MLTFDEATLAEKVPNLAGRREAERLWMAHDAASTKAAAIDDCEGQEFFDAVNAEDEAFNAYQESDCPAVLTNDDDDAIERCALSGLPLLVEDELLVGDDGLEKVLRCLVLPPHPTGEKVDGYSAESPEAADQPDDEVAA